MLEKVKDSDDLDEMHASHGVKGHRIDSSVDERKYKKTKNKKTKNKKTKNKSSRKRKSKMRLYPYFFGNLDNSNDTYYEPGMEGGFDGGGGGGE